jgi:hypothetical protein
VSKKHTAKTRSVANQNFSKKVVLKDLPDSKQTSIMSKYAGSIEFSDEELSAMLQELKEDR